MGLHPVPFPVRPSESTRNQETENPNQDTCQSERHMEPKNSCTTVGANYTGLSKRRHEDKKTETTAMDAKEYEGRAFAAPPLSVDAYAEDVQGPFLPRLEQAQQRAHRRHGRSLTPLGRVVCRVGCRLERVRVAHGHRGPAGVEEARVGRGGGRWQTRERGRGGFVLAALKLRQKLLEVRHAPRG